MPDLPGAGAFLQIMRVYTLPLRRGETLIQILGNRRGLAQREIINLQQRYATGGGIARPAGLQMFAAVQVDGFKAKRQALFLQGDIDRHHIR